MKWMKSRQAQAKLCELLDDADQGRPTTILRYGKPVAVLVPFTEYFELDPGDTDEIKAAKIAAKKGD